MHKIFKLCGSPSEEYWKKSKLPHATVFKPTHPYKRSVAETFRHFPSSALNLLEVLLATEPEGRGTASSALQNEVIMGFFAIFNRSPISIMFSSFSICKLRFKEERKEKERWTIILFHIVDFVFLFFLMIV